MPIYQQAAVFKQVRNAAFDRVYTPGTPAPFSGIYRCTACGYEVASNEEQPLPTQSHSVHRPAMAPIRWQLVAVALHKAS